MPRRNLALWLFGSIAWRCVREGLWLGAVYGLIYGTLYGACLGGSIIGLPYGLLIGALVGTMLGLADACVLGAFSVWWERNQGAVARQGRAAGRTGYRRTFTLIAVVTTMVGGLLVFPTIVSSIMSGPHLRIDPFLVLVPVLIAGVAALQASGRVVSWYEADVAGQDASATAVIISDRGGVWPPPPSGPV